MSTYFGRNYPVDFLFRPLIFEPKLFNFENFEPHSMLEFGPPKNLKLDNSVLYLPEKFLEQMSLNEYLEIFRMIIRKLWKMDFKV